jgi:membrane-associated phospholipid phosphatase
MISLSPARHQDDQAIERRWHWPATASDWLDWTPWIIIACLGVAAAVWSYYAGFVVKGTTGVSVAVVALTAASVYFRREERFLLCTTSLLQIVLFSAFFSLLTYLALAAGMPLYDDLLARWDAFMGFDLLRLLAWKAQHPLVSTILDKSYDTMLPQTAVIVAVLGFANDRVPLKLFMLRMMLAGLVTFVFIALMPAAGTPDGYGLAPTALQAGYLEHLHALRSGQLRVFDYRRVEGLATFPSFHAIWSMLMVVAVSHRRVLCALFALFNAVVIISTVTSGGHYLCDVWGGAIIAVVVCLLTPARKFQSAASSDSEALRPQQVGTAT